MKWSRPILLMCCVISFFSTGIESLEPPKIPTEWMCRGKFGSLSLVTREFNIRNTGDEIQAVLVKKNGKQEELKSPKFTTMYRRDLLYSVDYSDMIDTVSCQLSHLPNQYQPQSKTGVQCAKNQIRIWYPYGRNDYEFIKILRPGEYRIEIPIKSPLIDMSTLSETGHRTRRCHRRNRRDSLCYRTNGLKCNRRVSVCGKQQRKPLCICKEGYGKPSPPGTDKLDYACEDIDECATGTHTCDRVTKDCVNNEGSFRCVDKPPTTEPATTTTESTTSTTMMSTSTPSTEPATTTESTTSTTTMSTTPTTEPATTPTTEPATTPTTEPATTPTTEPATTTTESTTTESTTSTTTVSTTTLPPLPPHVDPVLPIIPSERICRQEISLRRTKLSIYVRTLDISHLSAPPRLHSYMIHTDGTEEILMQPKYTLWQGLYSSVDYTKMRRKVLCETDDLPTYFEPKSVTGIQCSRTKIRFWHPTAGTYDLVRVGLPLEYKLYSSMRPLPSVSGPANCVTIRSQSVVGPARSRRTITFQPLGFPDIKPSLHILACPRPTCVCPAGYEVHREHADVALDPKKSCYFTASDRFAYHGELIRPWKQAEYTTDDELPIWPEEYGVNRMRCMNGRLVNDKFKGCPITNTVSHTCPTMSHFDDFNVGIMCSDDKCRDFLSVECQDCVRQFCRDIDECERSKTPLCPPGHHCVNSNGFHLCEIDDLPADNIPYLPSETVCIKKYGDNWFFVHTFEFDNDRFRRPNVSYSVSLAYADGQIVELAKNTRHCYYDTYLNDENSHSDNRFSFDDIGAYLILRSDGKLNGTACFKNKLMIWYRQYPPVGLKVSTPVTITLKGLKVSDRHPDRRQILNIPSKDVLEVIMMNPLAASTTVCRDFPQQNICDRTSRSRWVPDDAYCVYENGQYVYKCLKGFAERMTVDGVMCTDIDECPSNPCKSDQTCFNIPGSHYCEDNQPPTLPGINSSTPAPTPAPKSLWQQCHHEEPANASLPPLRVSDSKNVKDEVCVDRDVFSPPEVNCKAMTGRITTYFKLHDSAWGDAFDLSDGTHESLVVSVSYNKSGAAGVEEHRVHCKPRGRYHVIGFEDLRDEMNVNSVSNVTLKHVHAYYNTFPATDVNVYCYTNAIVVWVSDDIQLLGVNTGKTTTVGGAEEFDGGLSVRYYYDYSTSKSGTELRIPTWGDGKCLLVGPSDHCTWASMGTKPCDLSKTYCHDRTGDLKCRCRTDHSKLGSSCVYNSVCLDGYEYDAVRSRCADVDECETNPASCRGGTPKDSTATTCVNTLGSFTCVNPADCPSGFTYDNNRNECVDVDECGDPSTNDCDPTTTRCVNSKGAFFCKCLDEDNFYLSRTGKFCNKHTFEYRLLDPNVIRCCSHSHHFSAMLARCRVDASTEEMSKRRLYDRVEPVMCVQFLTPQSPRSVLARDVFISDTPGKVESLLQLTDLVQSRLNEEERDELGSNRTLVFDTELRFSPTCKQRFRGSPSDRRIKESNVIRRVLEYQSVPVGSQCVLQGRRGCSSMGSLSAEYFLDKLKEPKPAPRQTLPCASAQTQDQDSGARATMSGKLTVAIALALALDLVTSGLSVHMK